VAYTRPGAVKVNLSLEGGSFRNKTGSHVEADTFGAGLSLAYKAETSISEFTYGAFIEAGTGSYNTYNEFINLGRLLGDGDARYFGGGLFAHNAFSNGLYLEGSVRGGSIKNDYKVEETFGANYDTTNAYWGAHGGLGAKLALTDAGLLDLYGKLFWTRTDSDSVSNSARNDRIEFDAVDSLRTRLGGRYTHGYANGTKLYVGAAWEHEFDGEAGGRVNDIRITNPPSLKGSSAFAEAGVSLAPGENYSIDLGLFGVAGQQRGLGGTVGLKLEF
jgi:outer membrane autotransporter protein